MTKYVPASMGGGSGRVPADVVLELWPTCPTAAGPSSKRASEDMEKSIATSASVAEDPWPC